MPIDIFGIGVFSLKGFPWVTPEPELVKKSLNHWCWETHPPSIFQKNHISIFIFINKILNFATMLLKNKG